MTQRIQLATVLMLTLWPACGAPPALLAKEARPAPAAAAKASNGNPGFGEVIEINVINVDVSATDDKGRPVTGLKKGDFELLEDGKPIAISNFETITLASAAGAPAAGKAAAGAAGAKA